jgi:hypothetical protein
LKRVRKDIPYPTDVVSFFKSNHRPLSGLYLTRFCEYLQRRESISTCADNTHAFTRYNFGFEEIFSRARSEYVYPVHALLLDWHVPSCTCPFILALYSDYNFAWLREFYEFDMKARRDSLKGKGREACGLHGDKI